MSATDSELHRLKIFVWIRQLYDWCMDWAEHKYGPWALALLATIESIFFPIPVDPVLIAMGAAKPKKAIYYATIATAFSVGGGVLGYLLGFWFWDATQGFFFQYVFPEETFNLVLEKFRANAFWAIFLAGFTPIPFKVFTVAAGVAALAWPPFLAGALLGRGIRFGLFGVLLFFFGPSIRRFIDQYFERLTLAVALLIILGLVVYKALI